MKKLLTLVFASITLIACTRTSNPENLAGKIDMSRPVGYVMVSEAEKNKTIYIMTGEKREEPGKIVEPDQDQPEAGEESEETDQVEDGDNADI